MTFNTTTDYLAFDHGAALSDSVMEEERANIVAARLINYYSVQPGHTSKQLSRWQNPGRAQAATQGVRFTETTPLALDSLSLSPSEFAVMIVALTNDAVELRTKFDQVAELFNRGTFEEQVAAVLPEARIVGASLYETLEYETTGLFSGASRSVGSDAAALDIDDFDDALLMLEGDHDLPHDDIVACLDKEQHGNLRKQIAITSGGLQGTIWDRDLAGIVEHRANMPRNGLKGALLGVPVFVHGKGVRQTVNAGAGVVGGMMLRGWGAPEDGEGQVGALAFVQGRRIVWTLEGDHRERGAELQGNWKGITGERNDDFLVELVSLAPA